MGPKKDVKSKSEDRDKSSQAEQGLISRAASAVGGAFSYVLRRKEEEYDPYKHRQVEKPTNYWESLAHLLKGALGTGILAMPQGFSKAGLIPGFIFSVLATLMLIHCMRVLIQQEYYQAKVSRVPYMAYRDAAAWSLRRGPNSTRKFAKLFAIAVDFFLGFYHLGVCVVYVIFMAESLKKLIDPITEISVIMYVLYLVIPLIAFNMIPNLKYLAPFSALANVLTFIGVGIVLYFVLATPNKSTAGLDLWGDPASYPLYFGTVLFALAAVGVLVAIENNMKEPQKFCTRLGVLNVGMVTVATLYITVAILGYNFCRDQCSDVIILDMPPNSWLADTVVVLFIIAIFISYGLNCFVPVEIVYRYARGWMSPDAPKAKVRIVNYIVRVVLAIISFIAAVLVPKIGLFISLFGALCLSAMGIIFPVLMEALTRPGTLTVIKDVIIIVVGFCVMVTGTLAAIEAIVRSFTD